jgi:hypothetical protein
VKIAAAAATSIMGSVSAQSMFAALTNLKEPIELGGLIPGGWNPKKLSDYDYLETAKNGAWGLTKPERVCAALAGCGSTPFGASQP